MRPNDSSTRPLPQPADGLGADERARELLAAEFEADRYEDAAHRIRANKLLHPADKAALRAIIRALALQQMGGGVRERNKGYRDAFYELATLMGIGGRIDTPKAVWEREMLPRLRVALASQSSLSREQEK